MAQTFSPAAYTTVLPIFGIFATINITYMESRDTYRKYGNMLLIHTHTCLFLTLDWTTNGLKCPEAKGIPLAKE